MLYYLGSGTEFKKEDCKEYKTKEGAMKAAIKIENAAVWDEIGQVVFPVVDESEVPDTSVNAYDKDGGLTGTADAATVAAVTGENDGQQEVIIPQGTMRATVICDGTLNLRRSPAWGNENICGRAVRGQTYYVKEIHTVDGKRMVRTIDNLYLSGQPEHVQFEKI